MDKDQRIYIAPKRGRLPRRYEYIGDPHPYVKLRTLFVILVLCGLGIWWIIGRISH